MNWDSIKGWIGQRINGVSYNIDIINACSLRCPSCAVGSMLTSRGGKKMTIELFRSILDKAQSEGKVRKVQFYAYSDPCLHPDLHLFIQECTDRGIYSAISTMMQTYSCDLQKVLDARPTEFRISWPGWEKMSYYQKGASPERFNRNIEMFRGLKVHPKTKLTMAFHLYNDNQGEYQKAVSLALNLGAHLTAIPAIFMPLEKTVEKYYTPQDLEIISHMIETPEESMGRMKKSNYCLLWKQITIDSEGMVYLCQLVYEDRFRLVPFLSVPLKQIQKRIKDHSFCGKCMEEGGQVYQYCFADFVKSDNPIADADRLRRVAKENAVWKQVTEGG
jgi:MoaA/NifB/PqqE/SkfB family radical SAM enzyme